MIDIAQKQRESISITLFEDQLVRNYFDFDNGRFMKHLVDSYDTQIITNRSLYSAVCARVTKYKLDAITVTVFEPFRGNIVTRLCSFFLLWTSTSESIEVKLRRTNRRGKLFRIAINRAIKNYKISRSLFRQLFYVFNLSHQLGLSFNSNFLVTKYLFATSLTNLYEDVPVCIFMQKRGSLVMGTVRSWDNLTSHGLLPYVPRLMLVQSEFMRNMAITLQGINENRLAKMCPPNYQAKLFRPKVYSSSASGSLSVTYACLGPSANPDEIEFISFLVNTCRRLNSNFRLTILQHPKFQHNQIQTLTDVEIKTFDYLKCNPASYYAFLQDQDVVICGGTSVALDCAFLNLPLLLVNFEISQQEYWKSALRSYDKMVHTSSFLPSSGYRVIKNPNEFLSALINKEFHGPDISKVKQAIGYSELDLFDSIKFALVKLQDL